MDAVNIWKSFFPDKMFVPFDGFMNTFQKNMPGIGECQGALQLFYNFPRDNVMTSYRFQLLLAHFGPWECLCSNLKVACDAPFIGLVNSTSADKLIEGSGYYVVRFSRKEPQSLTLSFNNGHIIKHKRTNGINHIREIIENNKHKSFILFPSSSRVCVSTYNIESIAEYAQIGYADLIESF